MTARSFCVPAAAILAAGLLSFPVAHAQLGDLLKHEGGSSGGLGNLGGMLSGQSMTSGSLGNVAGLLEFCVKNNYLNGNGVSSVKNSLIGKLSGKPSSDNNYTDGAKGILNSSNGKQLDLSGGGLKERVTKQICDKVLAQGKSML